ncbi:Hypothetical predicted protein [Marmota monax]|uniref:Uncharacterized protein n=1 Tax=Marmota monax TaxID=9995 RepID=A0A5E4AFL9_MARMO|nr:hypothetical protein GHT09_011552 [Marmota monax]VTJ55629.1 Hypothetical predicted protein [Marmota monax]
MKAMEEPHFSRWGSTWKWWLKFLQRLQPGVLVGAVTGIPAQVGVQWSYLGTRGPVWTSGQVDESPVLTLRPGDLHSMAAVIPAHEKLLGIL